MIYPGKKEGVSIFTQCKCEGDNLELESISTKKMGRTVLYTVRPNGNFSGN